jgi:electron-transferring-flavoprotein dehydrogenase
MERERETLEVDVAIVGGGPAGLAAAIHLVQTAQARKLDVPSVAVIEKAAEFGAHSLSGAILDPRGLDALLPNWRDLGAPVESPVTDEAMLYLTQTGHWRFPWLPSAMQHHGCYVVSLQKLVAWLATRAESLEINLFPGFAAAALLESEGKIAGVRTGDRGVDKKGAARGNFEAGYDVLARLTLICDGVRGNLSHALIQKAGLALDRNPPLYNGGVKEVWRVPEGRFPAGKVIHTMGWPLDRDTFGGAFLYGMQNNTVALGLVLGLDSPDPRLNPQERLQELKTHPYFRAILDGGELLSYGAKAIPEGGYWAIPKLAVDGAMLLGDCVSMLNSMRLKGIHLAIEAGIAAAETALDALAAGDLTAARLSSYERRWKDGPAGRELYKVRNFRQPYQSGFFNGMFHTGLQFVTGGRGLRERYPATEDHHRRATLAEYPPASSVTLPYDGKLIVDRMTDVYHSATRHEENQPAHLVVVDPELCRTRCREEFGNPCEKFCPAGVYELIKADEGGVKLHLNFSNCVHCKICDIADPYGVIFWLPPEGGEGPRYRST